MSNVRQVAVEATVEANQNKILEYKLKLFFSHIAL